MKSNSPPLLGMEASLHSKAICIRTYMNSAPWYKIKYIGTTSWCFVFNIVILWHEQNILHVFCFKKWYIYFVSFFVSDYRNLTESVKLTVKAAYMNCAFQSRLFQHACFDGYVYWQIAGNTAYCVQMTVERIQSTYIVYKYISLLWTD